MSALSLCFLLLQVPAAEPASSWLPYLFSAIALLLTLFTAFRKESREDGQTTAQRLRKMEAGLANQEARQAGFQGEIEGVADHAERERRVLADITKRDIEALREQIKDVPTMRELLYRMAERLENFGKTVDKLDGKTDKIVELLTTHK